MTYLPNIIRTSIVIKSMLIKLKLFSNSTSYLRHMFGCFILIQLLLNVSCKEKSSSDIQKGKNSAPLIDSALMGTSTLTPQTKQALEQLSQPKMLEGNIGDQITTFIIDGIYDYGEVFKFIDVRWKNNSAEILPKSKIEIDELSKIMILFPNMRIKMECYSDNNGNPAKLEKITQDRMNYIKKEIVSAGVNPDRITAKGFGSKYPVGDNKTMEGQLINNRIEVTILRLF